MHAPDIFNKLYSELNKEQKLAVDTIEGPVMVIAGPGTGKTQILTLRIANILKNTDTNPENILALTFTESAAHTMQRRLADSIGSAAYKVNFFTFHGFCNEIIKAYPEEFPRIIGANSSTDIDQIKLMERAILDSKLTVLKPYGDPLYYLQSVLQEIKSLKRDDISPDQLEIILQHEQQAFNSINDLYYDKGPYKGKMKGTYKDLEKNLEKNKELLILYKRYEIELAAAHLYDYEDMIMEVVKRTKVNQDLKLKLQEDYQYILADEHQDANQAQNHVLEILCDFHENPNLFIVGDEKQAIFRFQGASLENFLYFKKIYPQALLINLINNYRSPQLILDAAHDLIYHNKHQQKQQQHQDQDIVVKAQESRLKAVRLTPSTTIVPIKWYAFSITDYEYLFLIESIKEKIAAGVSPDSIAVLYRDNKDVFPIARYFEKTSIPFVIESQQDVFADSNIAKLLKLIRAINVIGNDELLADVLFIDFFNFDHLDIYKITTYARARHISLYDVIASQDLLNEAKVSSGILIHEFYIKLCQWSRLAQNNDVVHFFETIVRESGFLSHILSLPDSVNKLVKLQAVVSDITKIAENHRQYKLKDLIQHFDVMKAHNVFIKIDQTGTQAKSVHLMTAHKSKGLEFDYVYIVGMYDGHWSNRRTRQHFNINHDVSGVLHLKNKKTDTENDERRLLYVALTRARKEICISYAEHGKNNESQLPSHFIEEIDASRIEKIDVSVLEKNFIEQKTIIYEPAQNTGIDVKDTEFLKQLFLEQGLSMTALNKYVTCPWDYFFEILIRVPYTKSKHQLYGTAIHEALKIFFIKYKNDESVTKELLIELFRNSIHRLPFEHFDFEESLEKGQKALAGYYDIYHTSWSKNFFTEFKISGVSVTVVVSATEQYTIPLTGTIDKLEFITDTNVQVVEYKTGQPMSRNDIEGNNKNSDGNYKRQLDFYALLLKKHEPAYYMQSGIIDFIQPNKDGNYKKEVFTVTSQEIENIELLINKVAEEIITLSFWNKTCKEPNCKYCELRKALE